MAQSDGEPIEVPIGSLPLMLTSTLTPATAQAGAPVQVLVTARVTRGMPTPQGVRLQRLNTNGGVVAELGVMRDDGLAGDAVADDKIFSLRTTVLENNPGVASYRVAATNAGDGSVYMAPPLTVTITGTAAGIAITSPANASYLNTPVVTINGVVGDPGAVVKVNGIASAVGNKTFAVSLPLNEGPNTVTAVATNSSGTTSTASILLTLDTTPPRLDVYSPAAASSTTQDKATVTGLVNDIVVGTVNTEQVRVSVNGINAEVQNRSFVARDVPLSLGANTLQAVGIDRAGNRATESISVLRLGAGQAALSVVSGDGQSAPIGQALAQALVVKLTNAAGEPQVNKSVVFRVRSLDGTLRPSLAGEGLSTIAVTTDAQGLARAWMTLGSRAGAGNNRVEASAAGVQTTAVFIASGTPTAAALVVVDAGNGQSGVIGQALALPLIAIVTDARFNRLAGVPVTLSVKKGGGSIGGQASVVAVSDGDGRIAATLTLGPEPGIHNNIVEVSFAGNPGYPAAFTASGAAPAPASQTRISGVVLDNSNHPLQGVTMRLLQINQGNRSNIPQEVATAVATNEQGQFLMQPVPVGVFKLMADGVTAQRSGVWPTLEYDIITVSGQNNTVGLPIYLPELLPQNRLCVSETEGGTLTVPQAPGFALTIAPGSATFPGGARSGCVSVTPVNPDKVPMAPGFGQQPRFIVTIQPAGTHFNPPARMTMPNVDGLAPRSVTEMYSYDHDLASFVAIGSATVSDDGSTLRSDPGVGVIKAGWHCGGPPTPSGSAGHCSTCNKCSGTDCVVDDAQTPPQASATDCKEQICSGGSVATRSKDSEKPVETCKECKSGQPANMADWTKPRDSTERCAICKKGSSFTLPAHTTVQEDFDRCPDRTQQDDSVNYIIDGCSNSPDDLESWDDLPFARDYHLYVTNPTWGSVLGWVSRRGPAQTLACNKHDVCYQNCGSNRGACDAQLGADITASCDIGYPRPCPHAQQAQCVTYEAEYQDCRTIGPIYVSGVGTSLGLLAYRERQRQNCFCCKQN